MKHRAMAICLSLILSLSFTAFAKDNKQKHRRAVTGTPMLWADPGDVSTRDLFYGPGGQAMQPDLSHIRFIREETGGYSKKYRVEDGAGHVWVAKISKESQSETAANRLLWAIGYPTEITYLVPEVTIEGKGTFKNVRFEARPKEVKRLENWMWATNPFYGSREFNGLKVMMVLIENWDIKDTNNRIVHVRNDETGSEELRYIISDLGGTFGKTGGVISRSRNNPEDYAKAKFIKGVKNGKVEFNYNGKRGDLFKDIKVEDARWVGEQLARLSDQQINDAFRAANYSPEEIALLSQAFKSRVSELVSLPQQAAAQ
ncbi:MAG TPA: hypothetical protein VKA60_11095 [Blastocatellia bacterium]|nr:hypothetical protein [Blastocatellia bacterium]